MRRLTFLYIALICSLLVQGGISPAHADYQKAVAFYNQGNFEKAIDELRSDIDNNKDWEFGHRLLGLCYLNLKKDALAVTSLSRAVDLKSTAFSTYFGLGQAYFNMQKYSDCIATLNRGETFAANEKDPEANKAKLYRLRGSAYYRLNKFSEAVSNLTGALRVTQPDWTDFSMLGVSYFQLNRTEEAIEALEKSHSMRPNQPAIPELLGKAYLTKGTAALSNKQYAAAADFLKKAASYAPNNGYIYYNLAETYLFEKKYPDAENALNKASKLIPQNPDIYRRQGLVYEKLKKWDLALDAYNKAQSLDPSKSLKEDIARVKNNSKK